MQVIWFNAYTVLTLGKIALSTSLKGLGVSGNSYYASPGTVATIALTSFLFVASTMQTSSPSTETIKDEMLKQARISGFFMAVVLSWMPSSRLHQNCIHRNFTH
jgi:hypothetical protein